MLLYMNIIIIIIPIRLAVISSPPSYTVNVFFYRHPRQHQVINNFSELTQDPPLMNQ